MSKRVLIVCQHFWPEGFRVNDIADFLVERGCEVDVLCGKPNYPAGQFFKGYSFWNKAMEKHKDITIYRAPEIPRGNDTNIRIFLNYISFPFFSLFYIPFLLTKKYDKIFLYQLSPVMMSITGILLGKLTRTQTIMYVLDLWPENLYSVLNIKSTFLRAIAGSISHWHYKHVDRLIALSGAMKDQLTDVTGLSEDNIIVLPQAAEKLYEQDIQDKELEKRFRNGFNLVFAGSITPAQSFETIINAAKILRENDINDINWIIVGDGMSRKQVEADIKKAGLDDIFFFEGQKPVSDIPKYNAIADGFIGCLVKSELLEATIPAKVMSYIAAGKPVVLAMDGEVQTLINATIRGGYAVPTGDSNLFAKSIESLYRLSPKERENMGERLRVYHFKNFERNILFGKLYGFIFPTKETIK